jgi:hypothetical protein
MRKRKSGWREKIREAEFGPPVADVFNLISCQINGKLIP